MTFPVNIGIPAANNAPADDQPIMQLNIQNLVNTIAVDHLSPNVAGSGKHKQVQFLTAAVAPGAQIDPASVIYPASLAGQASPVVEAYYSNASGIFPMSAIKAFAVFKTRTGNGVVAVINGFNINQVNRIPPGTFTANYEVTFNANIVTDVASSVVLVTMGDNTYSGYSNSTTTKVVIGTANTGPGVYVNIMLLQI